MILYKAKWHNRIITKVNRFYLSSKTCSSCGHIYHGLRLKERSWTCDSCHAHHDRDENACLNLFNYKNSFVGLNGKKQYIAGTANYACGGNVRLKTSKEI